jgi:hypothetical protein
MRCAEMFREEIDVAEINDNSITRMAMTARCSDKLNCSPIDLSCNRIKVFLTKLETKSKLDCLLLS